MSHELTTVARQPAPSASNPFHEGYLAAAAATKAKAGPLLPVVARPYPPGSRAAAAWDDGVIEWALDRAAGLTPPFWRL